MTRLRLGSHYLRVETGRWARIPPERRTCSCQSGIQDELHVLLHCPLTQNLRIQYNLNNCHTPEELFSIDYIITAEFCKQIMDMFQTKWQSHRQNCKIVLTEPYRNSLNLGHIIVTMYFFSSLWYIYMSINLSIYLSMIINSLDHSSLNIMYIIIDTLSRYCMQFLPFLSYG